MDIERPKPIPKFEKWRKVILIIIVLSFIFLGPALLFRFIIYSYDILHRDYLAASAWFAFLALRSLAICWLIYILFQSFKKRKSMLKLYGIVFLFAEIIFSFLTDSNGMIAYTTINWHCRYWHTLNHLGYRDSEPATKQNCGLKVLTIGDSYMAGYGITDVKYRFDQLLQEKSGNKWCFYCAAEPGLETKEELRRLEQYPVRPDVVVLGYYLNDLDSTLINHKMGFPDPPEVEYCLNPLVTGSAVFDFLFIRYAYLFHSNPDYYAFMTAAFNNEAVMNEHYADLKAIIDFTKKSNSKLIVLIFPELTDLEQSNKMYVSKFSAFFGQYCPVVINVGDLVKNMPVDDRIASKEDTHPSAKVNQAIADTLFTVLSSQEKVGNK